MADCPLFPSLDHYDAAIEAVSAAAKAVYDIGPELDAQHAALLQMCQDIANAKKEAEEDQIAFARIICD